MNILSQRLMMSVIGLTISASSYASVSLGGGGSGVFAQITNFFQEIVNFLGGTGAMFVIFLSFTGAIGLWVISPKSAGPAVAWGFRGAIGGILLFAMGTLISWIKTF
ncbi:hypothetical protein L1D41_24750 [Vibrio harveyi]|uniref:hypothetical protein n=1 Tax=Vibrio harveyi TaxID=669 RepID=UPI001EFC6D24|nr:hypothetical protein [Vibrio harveyi]MCG9612851.1 hypothetical protein [Vibrio harveyi]MCG9671328.1 hypothetical protein [Vibrio harveyi]